jgi:hypothetical protein
LPQRLGGGDLLLKADPEGPSLIYRAAYSHGRLVHVELLLRVLLQHAVPQKVAILVQVTLLAICIVAGDDLRLLPMQLQTALLQPRCTPTGTNSASHFALQCTMMSSAYRSNGRCFHFLRIPRSNGLILQGDSEGPPFIDYTATQTSLLPETRLLVAHSEQKLKRELNHARRQRRLNLVERG